MTESNETKLPFIAYLETLRDREDRGALASLRRGIGRRPGEAPEVMRYVVPWVPYEASRRQEETYYLLASFFAIHPQAGGSGNLGTAMALAGERGHSPEALERRFVNLLSAHWEDLSYHLRQVISLLRSCDIPIAWTQLLRDLWAWDHPDRYVQRAWARSFWGEQTREPMPDTEAGNDSTE